MVPDRVPVRLAAFAVVLALAFTAAALAGDAIDPTGAEVAPTHDDAAGAGHGAQHAGGVPAGLAVSEDGYTLAVDRTRFPAGEPAALRFRIIDAAGAALRDFDTLHARELHLIVVRRDATGFQHLDPRRAADGTWSIALTLPEPGAYRLYADFSTGGEQRTLATDLVAPGDYRPGAFPTAATDPAVTLDGGTLTAGAPAQLRFAVDEVGELEPYLGARGHLVALREGDLAYLHVHPEEGAGSAVAFAATFPTAGRYRLFLQYKVDGEVRAAERTVEAGR